MASSGTIKSATYGGGHLWLTLNWSVSSQDIANNRTTISWNLKQHWDARISYSASKKYSVKINGTTYSGNYTGGASGNSGSVTLKSGTTTISHNADGTKTFSMSASYTIDITYSGSKVSTMSLSGSGTLNTIPRASSISVSSGSGTKPGNGSIALTIGRASSSFTHTVNWSCSGLSGTVGTGLTTSASWAVPLSLIAKSPNANQTVTFTCYTYNGSTHIGTKTCTATVGYHSPSTISGSSGSTLGSSKSFTIVRSHGNFVHSLWYSFGSLTWQGIGSNLGTSASFTPPLSLCNQVPNATSGSMTIILRTYYGGTQIGADQYYYYTMNVPSSVVPSFSGLTCKEAVSDISTKVGAYVQNKSKLTVGISGASGSYGSTITAYKITVAGHTVNASSGTTGIITVSGNQTITGVITDSRGKTATKTMAINILSYANPKINGSGVERTGDTVALVSADLSATSLKVSGAEKNVLRYKILYKSSDSYSYTELTGDFTQLQALLSRTITGLSDKKSYEFEIYVGDTFGYNEAPSKASISTAFHSFDVDTTNGRVGIKKLLEHEDSLIEVPAKQAMYSGENKIEFDNILVFVGEE